jgi:flap endonuclease-1
MGINGFYSLFSECSIEKYSSELKGNVVLIDIFFILNKYGIGIRTGGDDMKNKKGEVISHLYAIIKYTVGLLEKGIMPFYVFDGKAPNSKSHTIAKRRRNKYLSREKCISITDKTSSEWIKYFKRLYSISNDSIEDCKKLLNLMGIPWIQSIEEADSQCAVLAYMFPDIISGVVTDDSDILIYGAPRIYKNFNPKDTKMQEITHESVIWSFFQKLNYALVENGKTPIAYDYQFLRDKLIEFCILLGCDYNSSRQYIKKQSMVDTAREIMSIYVKANMNIMEFPRIARKSHLLIHENFILDFYRVKGEYLHANVIVPNRNYIKLSEPNILELKRYISDKMGYDFDDVNKIVNIIDNGYNIFDEMHSVNSQQNTQGFKHFKTYRYKYVRNKREETRCQDQRMKYIPYPRNHIAVAS